MRGEMEKPSTPPWVPAWNRQPLHFFRRRLAEMRMGDEARNHAQQFSEPLFEQCGDDLVRQSVLVPALTLYAIETQALATLSATDPSSPKYEKLIGRITRAASDRVKFLRLCGLRATSPKGNNAKGSGSLFSSPRSSAPREPDLAGPGAAESAA